MYSVKGWPDGEGLCNGCWPPKGAVEGRSAELVKFEKKKTQRKCRKTKSVIFPIKQRLCTPVGAIFIAVSFRG